MINNIYLDTLNSEDMEMLRKWRNENTKQGIYRTPYLLTYNMQRDFFNNIINNRNLNSRYFGIYLNEMDTIKTFVGYCGLDKIEWENGLAEIALTIGKNYVGKSYGSTALELLLIEAFNNMRLYNIYGECYKCNPNLAFWEKMIEKYGAYRTILPARKFYDNHIWDSIFFNFNYYDWVVDK